MIPADYAAARERAGLVDRSDRGRIVVAGNDRRSYLQGLLTNDVAALTPGEGCYAAYLTAQGRMIADLWVYELGDVLLLTLERDLKDTVLAKLDQFIFSEDVQLGDVTLNFNSVAVVGPLAARTAASVIDNGDERALAALPEHGNLRTTYRGHPLIVLRVSDVGLPGYELLVEPAHMAPFLDALRARGAVDLAPSTADTLRIESGIPRFHRDMDEETIPLEAGIEDRAISLTKGCYVGQEVIIRVLHRGHGRVVRKLVGLKLTGGAVPSSGAAIVSEGREVGHVTSSTWSPSLERPIALGYVHRDFLAPGTIVAVDGAAAEVSALPLVPSAAAQK